MTTKALHYHRQKSRQKKKQKKGLPHEKATGLPQKFENLAHTTYKETNKKDIHHNQTSRPRLLGKL
jgi:hypothetical protein